MRILDTSAWIEWLLDSATGQAVRREAPPRDEIVVPTLVQFELSKWLHREAPELADEVIAVTQKCQVVPLNTEIALQAAQVSVDRKLPTADAIVYATALLNECELVTCDAHFEGLPGVIYVPKKKP